MKVLDVVVFNAKVALLGDVGSCLRCFFEICFEKSSRTYGTLPGSFSRVCRAAF